MYAFPAATRPATSTRPAAGLTEAICQAAVDWFDRAGPMAKTLVPAAEAAAERLIAGGKLYAAGNEGFADELYYRAGGFPFTLPWKGEKLGRNDVLLIGRFRPHDASPRYARPAFLAAGHRQRFGEGMVVHFAPHQWPQIRRAVTAVSGYSWGARLHLVDTGAPRGGSMSDLCLGQLSATALAWAFHGEVIAAATRKGKTLATYASDWEPGGRAWDASVKGKNIHPKYEVPPIPAGQIGRQYLSICRRQIAAFGATQGGQVRLAARRMATGMKRGGMVWILSDGHIHASGSAVPRELTRVFNFGRSYDWRVFSRRMPKGDMLLYMGYLRYPGGAVGGALRRGCQAVVVCVDAGKTTDRVTCIRSCWKNYDTVVELPNYPIRVLPSSGVVQTPQWYSLMAEMLAARRTKQTRRISPVQATTKAGP